MKIAEASEVTGLPADTIRFYEREGILDRIARGADGHRSFGPKDLRWLKTFERLRSTGMPLNEMKQYADLVRQGDVSLSARREMFEQHRLRLNEQQAKIEACRALIDDKIAIYSEGEQQILHEER